MTMAKRLKAMGSPKYQNDGDPRTSGPGFGVSMRPDSVLEPILKWPRTSRIAFLDSMSDVFHARFSAEFLGRIFATMALTPQHTYQVLTKRPKRMRDLLTDRRVQGAMQDALLDIQSHDDIDEVVRNGLGRRWSFIGPFETADLNTRGGIESHAAKMGPAYERMGAERGQHDPWTPELVADVTAQRRALLDLDDWDERVRWRDRQLIRLRNMTN